MGTAARDEELGGSTAATRPGHATQTTVSGKRAKSHMIVQNKKTTSLKLSEFYDGK